MSARRQQSDREHIHTLRKLIRQSEDSITSLREVMARVEKQLNAKRNVSAAPKKFNQPTR